MALCWIANGMKTYIKTHSVYDNSDWYANYLDSMIAANPDVIFFYVTDSTDI